SYNIVGGILGDLSMLHMLMWGAGGYAIVIADNHGLNWLLILAVTVVAAAVVNALVVLVAHSLLRLSIFLAIFIFIIFELSEDLVKNISFFDGNFGLFFKYSVPTQKN